MLKIAGVLAHKVRVGELAILSPKVTAGIVNTSGAVILPLCGSDDRAKRVWKLAYKHACKDTLRERFASAKQGA